MTKTESQIAFYFDANSCSGCKACQLACKDKHQHPLGFLWRRVFEISGGSWAQREQAWLNDIFAYNISLACNHCQNAICLEVCPTKAISKRSDGIVLIDTETCIGCKYCQWACPYGSPQFDKKNGHMTKCTFCVDYLDQGLIPSCVAACPMRALDFGPIEDLLAKYSDQVCFPLPSNSLTKPSLVLSPHLQTHRANIETATISNSEEVEQS